MSNPTETTVPTAIELRLEIVEILSKTGEKLNFLLEEGESKQILTYPESQKMVQLLSDLYGIQQELASRVRRQETVEKKGKSLPATY